MEPLTEPPHASPLLSALAQAHIRPPIVVAAHGREEGDALREPAPDEMTFFGIVGCNRDRCGSVWLCGCFCGCFAMCECVCLAAWLGVRIS